MVETPLKERRRPQKAWEQAYELIEQQILNLQIEPGEVVTEISLAERLGIGRTPVREALKKLEEKGLIITHNGRKRVYILTIREIDEIFDLKVCIEGGTARWAALRGQEEDFAALEKIMGEMKGFVGQRPPDERGEAEWLKKWLEIDKRLHGLLFRMAHNRKSESLIKSLNTQWHRLKVGILTMEGRIEKAVLEHEKFVQAILNRDASAAEKAMKEHLENLRKELVKLLKIFHYPTA
jgi:GntR family transcriptional regulator, rspAB operon transcriptional repressor